MAGRRSDEESIVITNRYDRILWSCNHTGKFPRNHRFVLGERIERQSIHVARQTRPAPRPRRAHSVSCAGTTPVRQSSYSDHNIRDRMRRWGVGEWNRTDPHRPARLTPWARRVGTDSSRLTVFTCESVSEKGTGERTANLKKRQRPAKLAVLIRLPDQFTFDIQACQPLPGIGFCVDANEAIGIGR